MKKKRLFFKSVFSRFSFAMLTILIVSFVILILVNVLAINYYYTKLCYEELSYISISAKEEIEDAYRFFAYNQNSDNEESFWDSRGDQLASLLHVLTEDTEAVILVTDDTGLVRYLDLSEENLSLTSTDGIHIQNRDEEREKYMRGTLGIFSVEHYYDVSKIYAYDMHIATAFVCLPVSVVRRPVNATVTLITVISISVMGIILMASYFVSRRITNPLVKISSAAKAVADGDFSVRVPTTGRDEIGKFAKVFNEMADSLEHIEKTRNDFIASVSHDLRSPMTSIRGYIEGMLNGVIPPARHEHYLGVVLKETDRLSRLVTTLLDISRIQEGERTFVMARFDICEMARQILFSYESRIEEKQLDVRFAFDCDHMYVLADHDAIYQVVYNLSDNAVKFSREGGMLLLSVTEKHGKIEVSLTNEGEGIAEEDLPFVFDRFYKADKSRGLDKSGAGLGLHISKKIVEAHKETISVESEYGKLCRFSFTLAKSDAPTCRKKK